ncbi:MAG: hypothetical protein QE271_04390 [Bacteriovoracaceae bacterium]|nr:hypothetical protein [Bacteriovoracaceae bacterium]
MASHHIWSNSRLIKSQDISAPDFPQSLKVPPINLSSSNWEFLGPIPKLTEAIALPGNCSSQKSNIDSIYSELKSGFMKAYDDNFVLVYNTYLKKFQGGDIHKRNNLNKFEIKHNAYFERNY